MFCFTQTFSSTSPSSLLLSQHTGLPTTPFSPCPSTIPWAPVTSPAGLAADSAGEFLLLLLQAATASLCLPRSSSCSPSCCSMTWTPYGSHQRGEDEYNCPLGQGIHSPTLLTPEPAKGARDSTEKLGSQRITSTAGIGTGQSLTHSSWFISFPANSPITPVYYLFLPPCLQILPVISICLLHLLSSCNIPSNIRQEPHAYSCINSSLICSICFSPASYIVLRVCVSLVSLTFSH